MAPFISLLYFTSWFITANPFKLQQLISVFKESFSFLKAMQQNTVQKFLVDGFPRNENNLEGWERMMSEKADVRAVLFFDCPEEVWFFITVICSIKTGIIKVNAPYYKDLYL